MENIFVEFLPPWVETGLQPAFYDKESGTVLQQTARMYARVNMLIRMFNKLSKNTKTTVEEYITKFNELYTYVHDYFDNLDVQEEINKKLDAMVEDGTLAEILNEYVDGYLYPEIKFEEKYYSATKTTYYVAEIPANDNEGNPILPKVGVADDAISDPQATETVRSYASRRCTTFATNGGYFSEDSESIIYHKPLGIVIKDGVCIADNTAHMPSFAVDVLQYLAVMEDGTLTWFPQSTTAQQMIDAGAKQVVLGQIPLIVDGADYVTSHPDMVVPTGKNTKDQFTVYAQKANKDIIVLVCNGDGYDNEQGLTVMQIIDILLNEYGVQFAFSVDGGGSSQFVYHDDLMNYPGDNHFTKERKVPTMIYFGKDADLNDYQSMKAAERAIDGEAKFKADNNIKFKSGYIQLTNERNLESPGVESYISGCRNKLGLCNDNLFFQHHNEDESQTDVIFNLGGGYISTLLGKHAYIPNNIPVIDSDSDSTISDIDSTTLSYVRDNLHEKANGDEPYTDSYAIIISLKPTDETGVVQQIAIPYGAGAANHSVVMRTHYPDTDTWSAWKLINETEWTPLESTKGTFEYKRIGNIVNIRGTANSGVSGVLADVPAAIRPSKTVNTVALGSGLNMSKAYLLNTGALSLYEPPVAASYNINFTYMLG